MDEKHQNTHVEVDCRLREHEGSTPSRSTMIPYIQTNISDKTGNCLATCIASILEVPLESVPNFAELDSEHTCMVTLADKWLRENHSKRFISFEIYDRSGPKTDVTIYNRLSHMMKQELVILSGQSPRKTVDGKIKFHAVIGTPNGWGFEVVHDPHPDGTGIVGQPYGVKYIVGL
jgi:hypothetical protein